MHAGHTPDYLARRRAERRKQVRRQRIGTGVALLVIAGLAGVALGGGGDTPPARDPSTARSQRQRAAPAAAHGRHESETRAERPRARAIRASAAEPAHHRIPILMYHATEAPPPGARSPELWVQRERFAAEMAMLRSRGYHGITLLDAYNYWTKRTRVPRRPIVVSFDDGYQSNHTVAMPVLRDLRWPGVLNLEIGQLGRRGPSRITLGQVRGLVRAGWEIDAHTINHRDLTTLSADRLRYEVAEGRRQVRRLSGGPVNFFCYPAGKYDAAAIAEVKRAGFLGATTVDPGLASRRELWTLKRIRVLGSDTADSLHRRLATAR